MGGERFRWYSDGGMFVEMDRGGVLTYGKRRSMCVLSILKFACAFERHINVGAKSRRIDINTTSFSRHVPAGPFHG